MAFFDLFDIAASGMSAQRMRLKVISANLANVETTRTPEGGPYKRKQVVFKESNFENFDNVLKSCSECDNLSKVKVDEIVTDNSEPIYKYDPTHPDADANGFVAYPNINVVREMVDMIEAGRSFEANVASVKAAKELINQSLEIGKV
jgi:flagellar basal-body rod protein FlgC